MKRRSLSLVTLASVLGLALACTGGSGKEDSDAPQVGDTGLAYVAYEGSLEIVPEKSVSGYEFFNVYSATDDDTLICSFVYNLEAGPKDVLKDCPSCEWAFTVTASDTTPVIGDQCAALYVDDFSADGDEYQYGYITDYAGYGPALAFNFPSYGWYAVALLDVNGSTHTYKWIPYGYAPYTRE